MTVTEKAAYLRGLAEGLSLDADKPETKIINAVIDLLDDLALTVSDLEDSVEILNEQVDAVDEDLDELESYVYEDEDYDEDDDDLYEVICPECGEPQLKRKISAAGFRLKGGGWYETDFKSGSKKNLAGDSGSSGGDSKPAASPAPTSGAGGA